MSTRHILSRMKQNKCNTDIKPTMLAGNVLKEHDIGWWLTSIQLPPWYGCALKPQHWTSRLAFRILFGSWFHQSSYCIASRQIRYRYWNAPIVSHVAGPGDRQIGTWLLPMPGYVFYLRSSSLTDGIELGLDKQADKGIVHVGTKSRHTTTSWHGKMTQIFPSSVQRQKARHSYCTVTHVRRLYLSRRDPHTSN